MFTTTKELYQYFLQSTGVTTDSRKINKDSLYISLKGPTFDGNVFAESALAKGAKYAVIDDVAFQKDERYLLVENGLTALQELATEHRRQLKIACIGLTGTNGKTTTKELIYTILKTTFETTATKGNLNNHIGVPLTILGLPKNTEMAVVEMGANHLHEINQLCMIARPNFGLITNIGKAHLEGFGSIEGVAKTKGELFEFLEAVEGRAFINLNDDRIANLGYFLQKASTYGSSRFAKTRVELLGVNPFLKVRWYPRTVRKDLPAPEPIDLQTQLIGSYNMDNVTAAIAVGQHFRVMPEDIKRAIENYQPQNNRSQLVKMGTNTLILDAYNANPSSMQAAIISFEQVEAAKKVLILGDMLELGTVSEEEHQRIFDLLQKQNFDLMVLVGKEFAKLKGNNEIEKILFFDKALEVKEWWQEQNFENAYLLVKGSRGIALERVFK